MLDKELSNYYETYFDLFTHNGWKLFTKDLEEAKENYTRMIVDNKLSNEDYHYWRGEIARINVILGLKTTLENAYEGLRENADISI